jgi:radical SAM protein with 4Fe4S-binding SPASM domain
MREIAYRDFSLQLHEKSQGLPISGQFELTHRCNLRCRHCYVVLQGEKTELCSREIFRILTEIREEGCLWLCLTGGEPLLREDFLDIYSYAYRKGFMITIFTNAVLVDEKVAQCWNRFPPFCIEVTVNGVTKNTYEGITQVKGSFEKAMEGIKLIRKNKLPLKLKCQLMTLNADELPLMRRFFKRMGLEFRCSALIEPRMDGSTEPCSFRLQPEEISKLGGQKEATNGRDEFDGKFSENGVASDNLFCCPGGRGAFHVSPYGELFFCNSVRKPSIDLRKDSFQHGFYGLFPKIRSQKFETDSSCRRCPLRTFCLWCPGRAYLETGDKETPIPYYCELAKLSPVSSAPWFEREKVLERPENGKATVRNSRKS